MGNQHATSRLPRPALLPSAARAPRRCQSRVLIDQHDRKVAVAPRTSYQGPQRAASTRCSICSVTTSSQEKVQNTASQPASLARSRYCQSTLYLFAVTASRKSHPGPPPKDPISCTCGKQRCRQLLIHSFDLTSSSTCNPSHPTAPRKQPLDRCNLFRPCCDRLSDICSNHIRSLPSDFPILTQGSRGQPSSSTAHTVETASCNTQTPRTLHLHAHGSILGSGEFTNELQSSDWLLDPILEAPIFPTAHRSPRPGDDHLHGKPLCYLTCPLPTWSLGEVNQQSALGKMAPTAPRLRILSGMSACPIVSRSFCLYPTALPHIQENYPHI